MKKLYLFLLAVLLIPFMGNAQFSEDFNNVPIPQGIGNLPTGWTTYDEDGLTPNSNVSPIFDKAWKVLNLQGWPSPAAASTSAYTPVGQSDDWMVTPQITVPTTDPFLLFEAAAFDSNAADDYEVLISTTGNTPADFSTIIHSETTPPSSYVPVAVDLSAYAGQQVYIAFHNIANNEFILMVDNIQVLSLPDNNVAVTAIDLAHYFEINTNNTLDAIIKNVGGNVINSVDIEWTDGANTYTYSATGLNLIPYTATSITHDVPVTYASMGEKTITVTASNINGAADVDPTNNTIQQKVVIASQSVVRMPLYEQFTSSTCGPCATFNTNYFNQSFFNVNRGDFVLVKYQVNWPRPIGYPNGDPYYTAEGGVRVGYYGISAAPTLLLNAEENTYFNTAALQATLGDALTQPAFFEISGDYTVTGNAIEVNVTTTPYLNGDYVLHVAVVENETTQNATSNGETSFENVMMKMLPDAQGTILSSTAGTPITNNFTMDLSGTNVEEMSDLSVVVFVQDNDTKSIMQSAYATNTMGISDNTFAQIAVYPNPSNGFLKVETPKAVDIQINNILGKTVFVQKEVTSETVLNVSNLNTGVYFVTITNGSQNETKKIIIK